MKCRVQRYATAIEKALAKHPDWDAGKIIRYGCPDTYRVGARPEWCEQRKELGKTCRECWEQEVRG